MLSKSDLLAFRQCPRLLWLSRHRPDLYPPEAESLDKLFLYGNLAGEYARRDLGDFIWPATSDDKAVSAADAEAQLLANPDRAAVEVPLVRGGLYVRADALVPGTGGYLLRETKASTFPLRADKLTPAPPEEHHVDDVAIQAWVMEGSRLPIAGVELNLLDNQWRYPGDNDYRGLFRQLDVSAEAVIRKHDVPRWLRDANAVIASDMPDVRMGPQCRAPHICPHQEFCQALEPPGPDAPLTLLPDSAGKNLARTLAAAGYESLADVPAEELTGKQAALYCRIQAAHRSGAAVVEPGVRAVMEAIPYPRYYFDFEGIDLPVPRWVGVRPYEQLPFQWSCHIERSPGVFEHKEFLDLTGNDPSLPCIEAMLSTIDPSDGGAILVYSQAYEKTRLKELATRHPENAPQLERYTERLVDLLPIVKEHFYHPDMRGSFSIKKVLSVVAPHLRYIDLDEIQEGTGAQIAYLQACIESSATPERTADLRRKLLEYCELDTWAMVEVAYFLQNCGTPTRPIRIRD